jgi:hypothetical protein
MAGIYSRLLDHICAAPEVALERRMSLPAGEKAMVAAGALAGMARRPRAAQHEPAPLARESGGKA